jgi:hypothetical protein
MKIDIERLIDAVAAENEAYNEYIVIALKPYTVAHLRKSQPEKIMLIMRERFTTGNKTPLIHWRRFSKWTQRHATGFILQLGP